MKNKNENFQESNYSLDRGVESNNKHLSVNFYNDAGVAKVTQGFIKFFREKGLELLQGDPKAFLLLSHIALRARRTDAEYLGIRANQAWIGDHKTIGLTRPEYRRAKKKLAKYNLVSFQPTNRGTIATLICTAVFDINADDAPTEKPSNLSMINSKKEPINNQLETLNQPTNIYQTTIEEPLTRKKECKKTIMKENPLPHLHQTLSKPENLEDWKKKMISPGWTEEEFSIGWNKYLLEPLGSIKNVRKWLVPVMQSIRDSRAKEGHLRELAQGEAQKKIAEAEIVHLENEKNEKQRAKMVQKNKEFMCKIDNLGIGIEKYKLSEGYVKLFGEPWNGYSLGFSDDDFIKFISEHLGIDKNFQLLEETK